MLNLIALAALAAAPVITGSFKLDCPAGTAQVRKSATLACQDADGVFHGPYVSLYANGAVEATGQTEHGFRSGSWTFYDTKGVRVGETEFKRGNFDGRRIFYTPDGQVKSEERYSAGRLVSTVSPAPAAGRLTR